MRQSEAQRMKAVASASEINGIIGGASAVQRKRPAVIRREVRVMRSIQAGGSYRRNRRQNMAIVKTSIIKRISASFVA